MTKIALEDIAPAVVKEAIATGEDITITEDGTPIGRLVPIERRDGPLAGSITILGDIVEPIDVEWDAMK